MWRGRLTERYIQIWQIYIGFKNYKEIKTHSSEEREDKVVEGEIDNDDNDEYAYDFLMGIAPARSR